MALRALELCAGYGGFSLALRITGVPTRTVCYVEREAFAASVLVRAMEAGALDEAPVWSDLATFDGRPWRGAVDLVTAGFPCQPWSAAGKRLGEADERYHGVWPNIVRIVGESRPGLVFIENVSLDAFRGPRCDLEDLGYRVPPAVRVSASDVGAPHRRDRWWVLAHSECARLEVRKGQQGDDGAELAASERGGDVGNAVGLRELQPQGREPDERGWAGDAGWWSTEPDVGRVADGVAARADRLRALGNGIVPLCGAVALNILMDGL